MTTRSTTAFPRAALRVAASLLIVPILSAQAQDQPKSDADVLRGPTVHETKPAATLIQRDMSGHLNRLEARPEHAALDLLGLTPDQRTAPDNVLTDRYAQVAKLLAEHTDLFLKIQAGRQGGAKREELAPLMREFHDAAAPLLDKPLAQQVAAALPDDKKPEFTRIVDEYKRALMEEVAREHPTPPDAAAQTEMTGQAPAIAAGPIPPRLEMNLLLRETARALKAIVDERRARSQELFKAIDATPEQEAQIQAIFRAQKGKPGLRPSEEDRIAQWKKIMEVLTPEQRQKAMELRRGA